MYVQYTVGTLLLVVVANWIFKSHGSRSEHALPEWELANERDKFTRHSTQCTDGKPVYVRKQIIKFLLLSG